MKPSSLAIPSRGMGMPSVVARIAFGTLQRRFVNFPSGNSLQLARRRPIPHAAVRRLTLPSPSGRIC